MKAIGKMEFNTEQENIYYLKDLFEVVFGIMGKE